MSTFTPDRATPQSDDEALTAQQMQQAEELLFSEPPREGFADRHGFWGHIQTSPGAIRDWMATSSLSEASYC